MLILKLRSEGLLDGALRLGDRESVQRDGARLGERDLTLAVDRQAQAIGTATPHVHSNVVPHPKNVVGPTGRSIGNSFAFPVPRMKASLPKRRSVPPADGICV